MDKKEEPPKEVQDEFKQNLEKHIRHVHKILDHKEKEHKEKSN